MAVLDARIAEVEDRVAKREKSIERHEREIDRQRREQEVDAAQLEGLKFARDAISEPIKGSNPVLEELTKPREPRIDSPWDEILRRVAKSALKGQFGYDDVIRAGAQIKKVIKKPSCRTQITGYMKRGFLRRVSDGKFEFTAKGLAEIGADKEEGPATAGPSTESVGLAGLPGESVAHDLRDGSTPSSSSSPVKNGLHSTATELHATSQGGRMI